MISARKDLIIERVLAGGLKDTQQRYRIQYLHPEEQYVAKIAIEHRIENSAEDKGKFFSIRFSKPSQLLDFVGHCIRGYIYFKMMTNSNLEFKKEMNIINDTLNFHLKKIGGKNGDRI